MSKLGLSILCNFVLNNMLCAIFLQEACITVNAIAVHSIEQFALHAYVCDCSIWISICKCTKRFTSAKKTSFLLCHGLLSNNYHNFFHSLQEIRKKKVFSLPNMVCATVLKKLDHNFCILFMFTVLNT